MRNSSQDKKVHAKVPHDLWTGRLERADKVKHNITSGSPFAIAVRENGRSET